MKQVRERKLQFDITYMQNLKWYKWINLQNRNNSQTQRRNLWLPKGKEGGGRINKKFGISRYKLLHVKQINHKVILYSTGSYIQYPLINPNGKDIKKNMYIVFICICITESLFCTPETQHCKSTICQFKKKSKWNKNKNILTKISSRTNDL